MNLLSPLNTNLSATTERCFKINSNQLLRVRIRGAIFTRDLWICNCRMQTVQETRQERLLLLKEKYRTWAVLNVEVGWPKTDPRLSQISKGSVRSGRGSSYVMGDATARLLEQKLQLPTGWMDTPPDNQGPQVAALTQIAIRLKEAGQDDALDQLVRIGLTFVEPRTAITSPGPSPQISTQRE